MKLPVIEDSPIVPFRVAHLDFNGLMPTFEHLIELLDIFQAGHYNALLIEWQDKFPWEFAPQLRNENSFTLNQVRTLYTAAVDRGLTPIPLVQCLGHMDHVLQLDAYAHMREVPHRLDTLNPLAQGARGLAETMIGEVLQAMPGVKYFHLGGDEAWTFGTHPDTKAFIEKHGKAELYLHHYVPLLEGLADKGIRGLLWHDMICNWERPALERLANKADVVVWGYDEHPDETQGHWNTRYIEKFDECGIKLWGATGFKGCDSLDGDLPIKDRRLANAKAWSEVAERYDFQGLIATGWSRFSCNSMQCEPIDAALDILLMVGLMLHDGKLSESVAEDVTAYLEKTGQAEKFHVCKSAMEKLQAAREKTWNFYRWLEHQLAFGEIYPQRRSRAMEEVLADFFRKTGEQLKSSAEEIRNALDGLVEPCCIDEYIVSRTRAVDIAAEQMMGKISPTKIQAGFSKNYLDKTNLVY